jgi:hypothetical protein
MSRIPIRIEIPFGKRQTQAGNEQARHVAFMLSHAFSPVSMFMTGHFLYFFRSSVTES